MRMFKTKTSKNNCCAVFPRFIIFFLFLFRDAKTMLFHDHSSVKYRVNNGLSIPRGGRGERV